MSTKCFKNKFGTFCLLDWVSISCSTLGTVTGFFAFTSPGDLLKIILPNLKIYPYLT